ncbi:MAG: hypothetical protein ACRCTZ_14905 [Sarcina sp.]
MFYVYKIKKTKINEEADITKFQFKEFKEAHEKFLEEMGLSNGTYKRKFREVVIITTENNIKDFFDEIPIRISDRIPSVFSLDVDKFKYIIVATQKYEEVIHLFYSNDKAATKEVSKFLNLKKDKDYMLFKKKLLKK